jgi:hypothetical protein
MKRFWVIPSILFASIAGCALPEVEPEAEVAPPPVFNNVPSFLKMTVKSMTRLSGNRSIIVSGYGIVVGLKGTGSAEIPAQIRQQMLAEIRRGGIGVKSLGQGQLTAGQFLASLDTAIVRIEGAIPKGAIPGTTFDVAVQAYEGTQTTSLEGGVLYTTALSVGGANLESLKTTQRGKARGPIVVAMAKKGQKPNAERGRLGRILGGGTVTKATRLELIANRDDHIRTADIADRINVRFPQDASDRFPAARALNGSVIEIQVLKRYQSNPQRQLNLIKHLYLETGPRFNSPKAKQLGDALAKPQNHRYVGNVALAWQGMGKTVLPIIQEYYAHEDPFVRLAAFQAGARLGHPRTAKPLYEIARGQRDDLIVKFLESRIQYVQQSAEERNARSRSVGGRTGRPISAMTAAERQAYIQEQVSQFRELATTLLGELIAQQPRHVTAKAMLRKLLNHAHTPTRMAAFKALNDLQDPVIGGFWFPDKLELAYVNLDDAIGNGPEPTAPMIWASGTGKPRIVVFGHRLSVERPILFDMWDNRLIIKADQGDDKLSLFYKFPNTRHGLKETIQPTAVHLIGKMAFNTNEKGNEVGMNLTYSQIVQTLQKMTERGSIPAPLIVEASALADFHEHQIDRFEAEDQFRPGFRTPAPDPDAASNEQTAGNSDGSLSR